MTITHPPLTVKKTQPSQLKALIMLSVMLLAAGAAAFLKPTQKLAALQAPINLEAMIPKQFGDWHEDGAMIHQQVNPEVQQALDSIYTQVLTRTYLNSQGYMIMLTIPYGVSQSDDLAAHDPEGCYPSQGFQIISKRMEILHTVLGDIPVRRMEASSSFRHEPVTYWFTVGNHAVNNGWERKKAQLGYALKREIPDGLLFRVSSIDTDTLQAYHLHEIFIEELLKSLPPESRTRIAGLMY